MTQDRKKIEYVSIEALVEPGTNPNQMSEESFALLVKAMAKEGFLQPVLVREPFPQELETDEDLGADTVARLTGKGWWRIVDGVHRVRAARACGFEEVPVVILNNISEETASALQIGMNRLRGELDLGAVAATLGELHTDGWSLDALQLTGFTAGEIDDLLKSTQPEEGDSMLAGSTLGGSPDPEPAVDTTIRPFTLELTFRSKSDLSKVKKGLRRVIGKGRDLGEGVLVLLGETE